MLRVLIIAHAPLAGALRAVAEHIDPDAARSVAAVDVRAEQSLDDAIAAGRDALADLDGSGTLILTDVYGATPCNAASAIGRECGARVIAGVNVPVLWRALGHLGEEVGAVAALAVSGGQRGLMQVDVNRHTDAA